MADQKIETLREVPRSPECCGKPMQKMQHPSAVTGEMVIVFNCGKCGAQQRPPQAAKKETR